MKFALLAHPDAPTPLAHFTAYTPRQWMVEFNASRQPLGRAVLYLAVQLELDDTWHLVESPPPHRQIWSILVLTGDCKSEADACRVMDGARATIQHRRNVVEWIGEAKRLVEDGFPGS